MKRNMSSTLMTCDARPAGWSCFRLAWTHGRCCGAGDRRVKRTHFGAEFGPTLVVVGYCPIVVSPFCPSQIEPSGSSAGGLHHVERSKGKDAETIV